jgi:hypothetical protein
MNFTPKHWLGAPKAESISILAPPILSVVLVVTFHGYFTSQAVSTFWWVVLVMGIDVSHVYSTLFRMYWDKPTFQKNKHLLILIPIVSLCIGILLYSFSDHLFWRVLAYIAVFHFVRQQYGFMRLYSRKETTNRWFKRIDSIAIYSATLYPLLYWHFYLTKKLSWFVEGDFVAYENPFLEQILWWAYILITCMYLTKEIIHSYRIKEINIPKNLIIIGTYVSWYVGIVAYQADLLFTLVNVVSHGIPYMGLIWIYGEKKIKANYSFTIKGVIVFAIVLLLLSYTEEFFWDVFVWNDHPELFPSFVSPVQNPIALAILVPLLVLPQVTHYVLDGFIWRFSKSA